MPVWLCAVLTLVAGCLFTATAQARDIAEIKRSGMLIVAVPSLRNPPFFFEEAGELKGLDIDLAQSLAQAMGVALSFDRSAGSFNEAIERVVQDKADLSVAKLSRTLERAQKVLFSNSYLTLQHALLVNRLRFAQTSQGRSIGQVMRDFDGTLGVIAQSSFVDYARAHFPRAQVREFPDWPTLVDAVARGDVTVAYRDAFEVKRVLRLQPQLSLAMHAVVVTDLADTIGIAVNAGNPLLLSFVNQFLEQRTIKYSTDQILRKYEAYLR